MFELILTIAVLVSMAVAILLFERKRADRIERDLGEMARRRDDEPRRPDA